MTNERLDRLKLSKDPRFNSGICTICGEHMDLLLHVHSQEHGFKDAYEQIKAGKYKLDYQVNYVEESDG
jgi:hypothetical protein